MSIRETQVLDKDTMNRSFVSKSATGTQIMAGGVNILGSVTAASLTVSGASTFNGALALGSSALTTTGTITAGTFSGSGASLTALNGSNISSGTVADARLSTNVGLLTGAQTFSGAKTYTGNITMNSILYFANGTTYSVNNSGNAVFNTLEAKGVITATGNQIKMVNTASRRKILIEGNDNVGIGSLYDYHITYGGTDNYLVTTGAIGNKFYANSTEQTAQIGFGMGAADANWAKRLDSRFYGSISIAKDLEVEGEIKAGINNEFPDPLAGSKSVTVWSSNKSPNATIAFDPAQAPTGTGAEGSIKVDATGTDAWTYYDYFFDVTPNEWLTFSAYVFCTTASKTSQLYIQWADASKVTITHVSTDISNTPTSWTRYSVTAQAPSTARYFRVRVDNDGGAGAVMYFSAFQVERGRAMTGFKPYMGGKDTSLYYSNTIATWKSGNMAISMDGQGATRKLWLGGTAATVYAENVFSAKDMTVSGTSTFTGLATFNGSVRGNQSGNSLRIDTGTGTLDIGAMNASYAHLQTSNPAFYFNKKITVDEGILSSYDEDLKLQTSNTTRMTILNSNGYTGLLGVTAPTIALAIGDTDTGLHWTADGSMQVYSNNVNMLAFSGGANIVASKPITTATGNNVRSIQGSSMNDSISLNSHNSNTWLRNVAGLWTFQGGSLADDWTNVFQLELPTAGSTANAVWAQLGQRQSNAADGRYKGVRIVKYATSAVVDGDFQAGTATFTGPVTIPSASYIKGTGAGASNSAWLGFYESNGTTRTGFVGDGSSGNDTISLYADRGDVIVQAGSGGTVTALAAGGVSLTGDITFDGIIQKTFTETLGGTPTSMIARMYVGTTSKNGTKMHDGGQTNALYLESGTTGETGGLAIDNDGVTIYASGDSGYVMRVKDEDFPTNTLFQVDQATNDTAGGHTRVFRDLIISGYIRDGHIFSTINNANYPSAALEVRELNGAGVQTGAVSEAPRISFHWSGRVAAQIGMDSTGVIRTFDNPGTGYESFKAKDITASGNLRTDGGYIYSSYGTIARSVDEWLRINEDGSHTQGTYFGSTLVRTDGEIQVGGSGSAFKATSGGAVTASASVTAPTVAASTKVQVASKFEMSYNATEDSLDFIYIG